MQKKIHDEQNTNILNKEEIWPCTSRIHLTSPTRAVAMGRSAGQGMSDELGRTQELPYPRTQRKVAGRPSSRGVAEARSAAGHVDPKTSQDLTESLPCF